MGTQVAAAVLIAGDSSEPYGKVRCRLVEALPVWDFHGTADTEQKYQFGSAGMARFNALLSTCQPTGTLSAVTAAITQRAAPN